VKKYVIENSFVDWSRLFVWWSQDPQLALVQINVLSILIFSAARRWYSRFIKFYRHKYITTQNYLNIPHHTNDKNSSSSDVL